MGKFVDADKLMDSLTRKKSSVANQRYTEGFNDALMRFRSMLHSAPAADVVLAADIKQLLWERNFAIEMLEKHGVKTAQEFIKSKFPYEKPKTELIDRRKIRYCWQVDADGEKHDGVTLQSIIDKMPTVDAVEVVRCKDCKHFDIEEGDALGTCMGKFVCISLGGELYPEPDYFCSYGERRNESEK